MFFNTTWSQLVVIPLQIDISNSDLKTIVDKGVLVVIPLQIDISNREGLEYIGRFML